MVEGSAKQQAQREGDIDHSAQTKISEFGKMDLRYCAHHRTFT